MREISYHFHKKVLRMHIFSCPVNTPPFFLYVLPQEFVVYLFPFIPLSPTKIRKSNWFTSRKHLTNLKDGTKGSWIRAEDSTIRSSFPKHKSDPLLLPELHRFPSLSEGQGTRSWSLPVLQASLQLDVPKCMGWKVGWATWRGNIPRSHLNSYNPWSQITPYSDEIQFSSMSERKMLKKIWNKNQKLLFKICFWFNCFFLRGHRWGF